MTTILSIWTAVMFVIFIAIAVWAWSSRQKKSFDEAANIPFRDDDDHPGDKNDG
ncbi:MAG: cbb3-type cytochrome c oxidase subunit 3 [Arenicellales bacterium]